MSLENKIQEDIKQAMRQRDMRSLSALRLLWSSVKQKHIDERVDFSDEMIISVLLKEKKKRRDSLDCYRAAGRVELADQEQFEIDVLSRYLPAPFSPEELSERIEVAFCELKPSKFEDISALMSFLRPVLLGRADMAKVSLLVKERLEKYLHAKDKEGGF